MHKKFSFSLSRVNTFCILTVFIAFISLHFIKNEVALRSILLLMSFCILFLFIGLPLAIFRSKVLTFGRSGEWKIKNTLLKSLFLVFVLEIPLFIFGYMIIGDLGFGIISYTGSCSLKIHVNTRHADDYIVTLLELDTKTSKEKEFTLHSYSDYYAMKDPGSVSTEPPQEGDEVSCNGRYTIHYLKLMKIVVDYWKV